MVEYNYKDLPIVKVGSVCPVYLIRYGQFCHSFFLYWHAIGDFFVPHFRCGQNYFVYLSYLLCTTKNGVSNLYLMVKTPKILELLRK
jgi:hypothetical protein